MPDIVLASASPRRTELLSRLGVPHRIMAANINEDISETDPAKFVCSLAKNKAEAVQAQAPHSIVIAADTTVVLNNHILNKPENTNHNIEFLEQLSGAWHEVFTGVAVMHNQQIGLGFECTRVKFRELNQKEILAYAKSGEGLDKAGGYGIQERGMGLVEKIDGDFFNVVGLPISKLIELATQLGLELRSWV